MSLSRDLRYQAMFRLIALRFTFIDQYKFSGQLTGSIIVMNALKPSISRLSALICKRPFPMPPPGPPLPPGVLVDEEISPVYDSRYFYPAKPGEILGDRYQALVKIGWGVSSTVWLARDLEG